jgi:hypothetical protein
VVDTPSFVASVLSVADDIVAPGPPFWPLGPAACAVADVPPDAESLEELLPHPATAPPTRALVLRKTASLRVRGLMPARSEPRLGASWDRAEACLGIAARTPGVWLPSVAVSVQAVSESSSQEPRRDDDGVMLSELVTAQLRAARAEVFHAWLASREKARQLAQDHDQDLSDRRGAA